MAHHFTSEMTADRSENDWLSTLRFQVDLKIKKRFRTFGSIFDFFYYLKVLFTLQNRFSIGHFSVATPMSAVTNIVSAFWQSNSVKYHQSLHISWCNRQIQVSYLNGLSHSPKVTPILTHMDLLLIHARTMAQLSVVFSKWAKMCQKMKFSKTSNFDLA